MDKKKEAYAVGDINCEDCQNWKPNQEGDIVGNCKERGQMFNDGSCDTPKPKKGEA